MQLKRKRNCEKKHLIRKCISFIRWNDANERIFTIPSTEIVILNGFNEIDTKIRYSMKIVYSAAAALQPIKYANAVENVQM